MTVYVCFECTYNGADSWCSVMKVVDNELAAMIWVNSVLHTEWDWREYKKFELEKS